MSAEERDSLPTSNANVNSRSRLSNDTHEEGVDTNEEGEDMNRAENTSLDPQDIIPTNNLVEPPADSWNLKTIYTAKDILRSNAVKCMGDKCRLVACSIWSSKGLRLANNLEDVEVLFLLDFPTLDDGVSRPMEAHVNGLSRQTTL